MKEQEFFARLNSELERMTPEQSPALQAQSIVTQGADERPQRPRTYRRMAAWIGSVAAAIVVCVAVLLGVVLGQSTPAGAPVLLQLDINPSVALVVGTNGKVSGVVSLNADGDTLIADGDWTQELIGSTCSEATARLVDRAIRHGFLDVASMGSAESYNTVTLTATSSADTEALLAEAKQTVTQYLCEKGVYVYVETIKKTVAGVENAVDALVARGWSYLASGELAARQEELTEYVYGYAEEALGRALARIDLYLEIDRLNAQLAAQTGRTYWFCDDESNALYGEIKAHLQTLLTVHGEDYTKTGGLLDFDSTVSERAFAVACELIKGQDLASLRDLYESGVNESTFGGVGNLDVRLELFTVVSSELLVELCESLFEGSGVLTDELASTVRAAVTERAQGLYKSFSALFDEAREAITASDYEAFLARIGKAA